MQAYAVRIFCFEWAHCLAFYDRVLELPLVFADDTSGWAEFDLGGVRLGLERCDTGDPEAGHLVGRFVGLSLAVDDITARYTTLLERGVEFTDAPQRQPWGGVLAHFLDPDGNVLTLVETVDRQPDNACHTL